LRSLIARLSHTGGGAPALSGQAADVMVRQVFTVREDTPLTDVIVQMLEKRVKRLVVTDAEGRLVGMVDRQSLLRLVAGQA
jgi:predicted transcriptional regulator